MDVFQAGLETLVTMLQSLEQFRHAVTRNGWNMLVEMLRRYNVRLRAIVCQVMTFCDVCQQPPFTDPIHYPLLTADQEWNTGIAMRMTENAVCYSALFKQPHSYWGLQATHMTQRVVLLTRRALISATNGGIPLIFVTLGTLSDQYDAHGEVISERRRALQERLGAINHCGS